MSVVSGARITPRAVARAGCAVAWLLALAAPGRAGETAADPAAPVGRIVAVSGAVSVHGPEQTQWSAAEVERTVAPGEGLWTQPGARATVTLGGAQLGLEEKTQVELANLTDQDTEVRLVQGAIDLRVPAIARGESYQVDTPRGAVRLMLAGRLVIEAGAGDLPTKVTVLEGAAQIAGT